MLRFATSCLLICVTFAASVHGEEEQEGPRQRLKVLLKQRPLPFSELFEIAEELGESGTKDDVLTLRSLLHHKEEAVAACAVLGLELVTTEERKRAMDVLRKELRKPHRTNGLAIAEVARVMANREYEESFPYLKKLFQKTEDPYVLISLCRMFGVGKDWRMFMDIYGILFPKGGTRSTQVNQGGMPVGPVTGSFLDGQGRRRSGGIGVRAFHKRYDRGGVTAETARELNDAAWLSIFAMIGHRLESREELQVWMTDNRKLVQKNVKEREKLAQRRLREARDRRSAEVR